MKNTVTIEQIKDKAKNLFDFVKDLDIKWRVAQVDEKAFADLKEISDYLHYVKNLINSKIDNNDVKTSEKMEYLYELKESAKEFVQAYFTEYDVNMYGVSMASICCETINTATNEDEILNGMAKFGAKKFIIEKWVSEKLISKEQAGELLVNHWWGDLRVKMPSEIKIFVDCFNAIKPKFENKDITVYKVLTEYESQEFKPNMYTNWESVKPEQVRATDRVYKATINTKDVMYYNSECYELILNPFTVKGIEDITDQLEKK